MVFARGGTFAIRCIQFAPTIRAKTISADLTPLEASFSRATCFIYRAHYWQTDKRETVNFFCSLLGFAYVTKRMKRKLRTAWLSIPLSWWKKRLTVSKTNRDFRFSFYTSIPIIHKKINWIFVFLFYHTLYFQSAKSDWRIELFIELSTHTISNNMHNTKCLNMSIYFSGSTITLTLIFFLYWLL